MHHNSNNKVTSQLQKNNNNNPKTWTDGRHNFGGLKSKYYSEISSCPMSSTPYPLRNC